ncbi:MAG TPA: hypothetical protein VMP68_26285 [Candidatus Eisenbacteria bacterium]|nr:hypothetical protein [Candidatus Eisenbacteria bacterium]
MANLPQTQRDKLIRILGMLGSDFDGERASAGVLASNLLKSLGLTWEDVIAKIAEENPKQEQARQQQYNSYDPYQYKTYDDYAHWRTKLWFLRDNDDLLSDWETGFVESLNRRTRITPRQEEILDQIYSKIRQKT